MATAGTVLNPASDADLGKIIENEISQADGADSSSLMEHRRKALAYYYNEKRGDEIPDGSEAQSSDLASMTNAVLAQITPMITSDALVSFESMGENDEDQCRMETDAVNNAIMDRNFGYLEMQQCLKDACLCLNAVAYVWCEDDKKTEVRHYRDVPKADVNRLVNRLSQARGVEAKVIAEEGAGEEREITVEVRSKRRKFCWRSVDPINFLFQGGWEYPTLDGIRFCAEVDYPTRSECLEEGYDAQTIADLPPHSSETRTHSSQLARNRREHYLNQPYSTDQERIERHRCCLLVDRDNDGVSELWEVVVGDRKVVLEKRRINFRPFAVGSLFIAPHRLQGEDLFDRLKQTQDIKTHAKRRWLDNVFNMSYARLGYNENAVGEEINDARAGGNVPVQGLPGEQIVPIPVQDAGASLASLLQYEDKERSEKAGAALDVMSGEAQLVGGLNSQGAIDTQFSVREQLSAMMATNISETLVRQVYLLMHKTMRTYGDEPLRVKLNGEWTEVDPRSFRPREAVSVTPGKTPQQRSALAMALQLTVQGQVSALQQGQEGVLVTLDGIYRAMVDFGRMRGLDNVEQYWVDPSSQAAQQAAQQRQQQQQQQQAMQQQLMQAQLSLEQAKVENERIRAKNDYFAKIYSADLDAEAKEAELIAEGRQHNQDLQAEARKSARETTTQ